MRHSRPAAGLAEAGQTPVAVAVNGQLRLLLGVADALRPDSPHGIRRLHGLGLETVLATGDTGGQPRPPPALAFADIGIAAPRRGRWPSPISASTRSPTWSCWPAPPARSSGRTSAGPSATTFTLVPLAAAGVLPPVLAAMAASSVTVVGNALRLRRFGKTGADRRPTAAA